LLKWHALIPDARAVLISRAHGCWFDAVDCRLRLTMSPLLYSILRPLLFALPPERTHAFALSSLHAAYRLHLLREPRDAGQAYESLGLEFANRIGLAAGFDKNARYIDALGSLGFGFIEVGTVTPRAQSGQDLPRLFRLPAHAALINRMGFPNDGADVVASRLARRKYSGIVGVNIGKNAATPLAQAIDDYRLCYRRLAPHADYVAINVSSPNTPDLRRLQEVEYLQPILEALLEEGDRVAAVRGRRVPLLAKISPDLSDDDVAAVTQLSVRLGIDGIIATNSTITRPADGTAQRCMAEQGGLSGAPLHRIALRVLAAVKSASNGRLVIVGVGGIATAADATAMFEAGADLIQVYTGLVYRGPDLVRELRAAERHRT
jgi:dihydroorotate dehydrogenase